MLEQLQYPDVLAKLTDSRMDAGILQYAVGIVPTEAMQNQVISVVLILQSAISSKMVVHISVRPPDEINGTPVSIQQDKKLISQELEGGEVGVLHIPIRPTPKTPAASYPIQVGVRHRISDGDAVRVRPAYPGVIPAQLDISPYKIHDLQENVLFDVIPWHQSVEEVTVHFTLSHKTLPPMSTMLKPVYERFWSAETMRTERQLVYEAVPTTQQLMRAIDREATYEALQTALKTMASDRSISLREGEIGMIAALLLNMLGHEEATATRWFAALAQTLMHYPQRTQEPIGDLIATELIEPLMADAAEAAAASLQTKDIATEGMGIAEIAARQSDAPPLRTIYDPLVLAALLLPPDDFPVALPPLLDSLEDAFNERTRSVDPADRPTIDTFKRLLEAARGNAS